MIRPRIATLPPDDLLTPEIRTLRADLIRIAAQYDEAEATVRRLRNPATLAEAEGIDKDAAVDAALLGDDALANLGTPAVDRLTADLANAERVRDASLTAYRRREEELINEFRAMLPDDKASGRANLATVSEEYRNMLDQFIAARNRFLASLATVRFIHKAANGPSERDAASYYPHLELSLDFPFPKNLGINPSDWPAYSFDTVVTALRKEINDATT